VQFTPFARFALTKLRASENSDVGANDILNYLACLCKVERVEMTGTRSPESRRFPARIQRKPETLPNVSGKVAVLAGIERKYDNLGKICEEVRRHVTDSLPRSEKFEINCDGSPKPARVISFQRDTAIQYSVWAPENNLRSAWMDRQPDRTQVSYCSLVIPKNSSDAMGQIPLLHRNDSDGTNGNP
jgi:hypothetical protein